jgi:plastocyanin
MKKIFSSILLLALLVTACGGRAAPELQVSTPQGEAQTTDVAAAAEPAVESQAPAETEVQAATEAPASPAAPVQQDAQTFTIEIRDNTFNPPDLTIPAGSTVVWVHAGQRSHTATADDASFGSDTLANGASFQHTFDQSGTFAYHCEFHGAAGGVGMAGTIIVEAAQEQAEVIPTGAAGTEEPLPVTGVDGTAQATVPPQPAGPALLGALNRDAAQAARSPGLAVGTTTAGSPPNLWITWAENSPGNVRQIFASELVSGAIQARGASLNIHTNVVGDAPTIAFAGEDRLTPWVAWAEPSPGFADVIQVFASRFNAATGLWQQAGQDRGGGEASLNLHTNRPAARPFVFSGSGDPTKPPVPWVAWEELSSLSSFSQIFVSKGVRDESNDPAIIGGLLWEFVGLRNAADEPSLNVDRFRNGLRPSGVFAESGNSVPWVTWHESGGDRPERVFTARGVADASAPGGFKWITVPACTPDEAACSLNVNPLKDAKDASMAAGSLSPSDSAVPWIAWAEVGPTGKWQIFVSRLDLSTRNSFLPVGGSLNVDQNHDARTPVIAFSGNVPYVAWLEDDGSGRFNLHLRHLASDPQTGTWALDTPEGGINEGPVASDAGLSAAGSPQALYLAWTEGDPAAGSSQVVAGSIPAGGQ